MSRARGGSVPAQFSLAARQPHATLGACTIPSSSGEPRLAVSILILGRLATGMSCLSPWATPMLPPFLKHLRRGDDAPPHSAVGSSSRCVHREFKSSPCRYGATGH